MRQQLALWEAARCLAWCFARLGIAAGGDRPGDHVRGDGRHQHGPRRDGHARGLPTFVVQQLVRINEPGLVEYSLLIPIPIAFAVTGVVEIVIEHSYYRYLFGRPLETLLATFGVSLLLQQAVRTAFGPTIARYSPPPSWAAPSSSVM